VTWCQDTCCTYSRGRSSSRWGPVVQRLTCPYSARTSALFQGVQKAGNSEIRQDQDRWIYECKDSTWLYKRCEGKLWKETLVTAFIPLCVWLFFSTLSSLSFELYLPPLVG